MNVQSAIGIVHVHDSTFQEGRSIFVLGQGHATCGHVFYEVDRLTHVSINVVELKQSIGSIVKVRVISSSQHVPSLARSTTILNLVAAIELQLGAVDCIELKLGAGEGSNICSGHSRIKLRLTLH